MLQKNQSLGQDLALGREMAARARRVIREENALAFTFCTRKTHPIVHGSLITA